MLRKSCKYNLKKYVIDVKTTINNVKTKGWTTNLIKTSFPLVFN